MSAVAWAQVRTGIVVAAAYFVSARLGLALMPVGSHLAIVWPPAGVAVAALVLLPRRLWLAAGLGMFGANYAANMIAAHSLGVSLSYALVNTFEPFLIMVLLRRCCAGFDVATPRRAASFLAVVSGGVAITAALGAIVSVLFHHDSFGVQYLRWLVADTVGIFVVTPLLVLWRDGGREFVGNLSLRQRAEYFASLLAIAAVSLLHIHSAGDTITFAVLGLTILLRVAFSFGSPGVALGIALQSALMIGSVMSPGAGSDVGGQVVESASIEVQLFLAAAAAASYISAAAFGEQRRLHRAELASRFLLEQSLADLQRREEQYRTVADYTYDWEYWTDASGQLVYMSPSCERITGYRVEDFSSDPGLFSRIAHPDDPQRLSGHTHAFQVVPDAADFHEMDFRILTRGNEERWIAHVCRRVFSPDGRFLGRRASNRDITARKRAEELLQAQLRVGEQGAALSLDELLTRTLDEAEALTGSSIGFFHFLNADQKTLSLQSWSTNTLRTMCSATGKGQQYPVDQAGVWVDCIRQRAPVIHNDYRGLPHRKGLPAGHAALTRELVVPVVRDGLIVGIFGLGNKTRDYGAADVEAAVRLSSLCWDSIVAKRIRSELQVRTMTLDTVFESVPFVMLLADAEGRILNINRSGRTIAGGAHEQVLGLLLGQALRCVNAGGAPGCGCTPACRNCPLQIRVSHALATGEASCGEEGRFDLFEGDERVSLDFLISTSPVTVDGARVVLVTLVDITERNILEERLRQAHKMEAIGTLAGGIAHDFNNVLNVIKGYGFLLERGAAPGSPFAGHVREVLAALDRGVQLTRSLLAFSRSSAVAMEEVSLNEIVLGMRGMIVRILGEEISLEMTLDPREPQLRGDAGQLGQILMNFATNARDALPGGGSLTISTVTLVSTVPVGIPEITVPPGAYAVLRVQDCGCGMPEEVRRRIFEPFFTTKEFGRGTGLGLAVVYGIVKQHRGHVICASAPGVGSVFTVYLPLSRGGVSAEIHGDGGDLAVPSG